MSAFWHPLSAIYLDEPRALASPTVLRMILAGEGRATVRYAGDRMWPALRHGQTLEIVPLGGRRPDEGEVVLTVEEGIVDLLRVHGAGDGLELVADADEDRRPVAEADLLGHAGMERRKPRARSWARLRLDLVEAWRGRPDEASDPALTVRDKYDAQARHYARDTHPLDAALAARLSATVPRGGRVLVAGSGVGREALAIEALGYDVVGVDFSARMVEEARAAAAARGSKVVFVAGDLREHEEARHSLDAVFFTYDVYSFIPSRNARRQVVERLHRALARDGVLFLSARRRSRARDRTFLTVQWLSGRFAGKPVAWGDSHTRWLDASGRLRRSFVHVFTPRALDAELRTAGFTLVAWEVGHGLYRRASDGTR
ncbi:MAG TPA: class I SAM-dependent methyltransferase [Candidatus Polarisedimenticolaceae bacterium]|nr:class I SAM-dependent methyltransferase [Candidatus Polarisedimenticolaceae bacterium]